MNTLFDNSPIHPPHQRQSRTSRAAAESVVSRTEAGRRQLMDLFRERGAAGMTDEEGIAATGWNPSFYRPRRIECVDAGNVRDSGQTRPTVSGRSAVVWVEV